MSEDKVTRIKVGGQLTGIIGLQPEHVRDPIEIANYGVIGSQGLIINKEVRR